MKEYDLNFNKMISGWEMALEDVICDIVSYDGTVDVSGMIRESDSVISKIREKGPQLIDVEKLKSSRIDIEPRRVLCKGSDISGVTALMKSDALDFGFDVDGPSLDELYKDFLGGAKIEMDGINQK